MYLGIDVGTTAVKVVLVDDQQRVLAGEHAPLTCTYPHKLWSEQDPQEMWHSTERAVMALKDKHPLVFKNIKTIGLSGQMHGAVLLDKKGNVLRPAILWNDGRAYQQCQTLKERYPEWETLIGNLLMPGFTAPKLLWVKEHEPDIFMQIDKILLPKDYIRFCLTKQNATDQSDASGTGWLDIKSRQWDLRLIEATELRLNQLPELFEGIEATGTITQALAERWQMSNDVVVVAGAGDNAASAISMNVIKPGQAFISLGTSGVYFVAMDKYQSNPEQGIHAFCHCLPLTWHQMSVHLNAASCLTWLGEILKEKDYEKLLKEAEEHSNRTSSVIFLPYLTGERTPHNNPHAKGVLFGLNANTIRPDITNAVLRGVAMAFAQGQEAMMQSGISVDYISVIGGGARSHYWCKLLASAINKPLHLHQNRDLGAALGAARLAWFYQHKGDFRTVFLPPPIDTVVEPCANLQEKFFVEQKQFNSLYNQLEPSFLNS